MTSYALFLVLLFSFGALGCFNATLQGRTPSDFAFGLCLAAVVLSFIRIFDQ